MGKWISVDEQIPQQMSDVLVTDGDGFEVMWWDGEKWESWSDGYNLNSDNITHWQPLPEPPQ